MFNEIEPNLTIKTQRIEWKLMFLVLTVSFIGVALLYSAANGNIEPWALKQLWIILLAIPFTIFISLIDLHIILKLAYPFYFLSLLLLITAEILGYKAMGAQRWLRIGALNLQPSEIMKIAVIIALAKYYHVIHSSEVNKIRNLLTPIVLISIPISLVLKQPNLGTALIIAVISLAILFTVGIKVWKFITTIAVSLVALPVLWRFLHDYQKQRIMTFLNPEQDPLGSGYNIIQSKIAIGSGGIFGKGFLQGTQNQLSFLPEKQTDFIFTLLSEEFGLFGVSVILLIFLVICLYCYSIAINCNNQFSRIMCIGVATMIFIHVFINVAMVAGILPAVGTPLPFLSYGGSNLITSFIGIGLVINAKINNKKNLAKVYY
jgi:rod shape determining protein RodA